MDVKISEGYDLSELKESAQKILTATENDFNEMKDQKWYKRIWGIITFSQRNKKITANNISNLSQAQQLIYKIIVNLSEKNVEVFSILEDLQDQIEFGQKRIEELNQILSSQKSVVNECNLHMDDTIEELVAEKEKLELEIGELLEENELLAKALRESNQ